MHIRICFSLKSIIPMAKMPKLHHKCSSMILMEQQHNSDYFISINRFFCCCSKPSTLIMIALNLSHSLEMGGVINFIPKKMIHIHIEQWTRRNPINSYLFALFKYNWHPNTKHCTQRKWNIRFENALLHPIAIYSIELPISWYAIDFERWKIIRPEIYSAIREQSTAEQWLCAVVFVLRHGNQTCFFFGCCCSFTLSITNSVNFVYLYVTQFCA